MELYQQLINMGFDEIMSLNAVNKFGPNMNKCIDYIQTQNNLVEKIYYIKNTMLLKHQFILNRNQRQTRRQKT